MLYTHERYFVLFILFLLAIVVRKGVVLRKDYKLCIAPLILVISFWGLRFVLFGNRAADGTGGTNINETFDLIAVIKFCFSQVGYLLGFNCGPRYLSGIEAGQVSGIINVFLYLRVVFIGYLVYLTVKLLISNKEFREKHLGKLSLFLAFIALCIVASSITIRVEMRWIYVSYTVFLLLIFYLLDAIKEYYFTNIFKIVSFIAFFIVTLITEVYYRNNYENLYYWGEKESSRALYCATIEKYGDELLDKEILIVSNNDDDRKFDWEYFLAPYMDSSKLVVNYVDSISQAEKIMKKNSIVLLKDDKNGCYTDITDYVGIKVKYLKGWYEDGWIEPELCFKIPESEYKKAILTFYYTEVPTGNETGKIVVNDEVQGEFKITGSLTDVVIELKEDTDNTIQILSDFWVHENTERSEDGRLSCVLSEIKFE